MEGIVAMRSGHLIAFWVACVWPLTIADARTLEVGPGKAFALPSQAAEAARDGDVVQIAPGNYVDCAVWTSNDLTIEATGPGVILSDKSCDRKGIFVINGNDVIVRGITFQRAVVPDRNGAGIRAQGGNLTVEHSTFLENQMGMLATGSLTGTVIVRDSLFARNGSCYPQCPGGVYMHALYVGRPIALLRVEHSEFVEQHDGHYVKSRALRSEIVDNVIHDGDKGTGSYLIDIPDGGTLIARGNRLEKGPNAENDATIAIGLALIDGRLFAFLKPRRT
jgi:tetrahydromethanopterin S-methyltransferase subunit F